MEVFGQVSLAAQLTYTDLPRPDLIRLEQVGEAPVGERVTFYVRPGALVPRRQVPQQLLRPQPVIILKGLIDVL